MEGLKIEHEERLNSMRPLVFAIGIVLIAIGSVIILMSAFVGQSLLSNIAEALFTVLGGFISFISLFIHIPITKSKSRLYPPSRSSYPFTSSPPIYYAPPDEAARKAQTNAHPIRGWMRFVAMLFYCLPLDSWIVYFIVGRKNIFLRFHFLQAVLASLLWFILSMVAMLPLAIITSLRIINPNSIDETTLIDATYVIIYICIIIIPALGSLGGKSFSIPILGQWAERFAHKIMHETSQV